MNICTEFVLTLYTHINNPFLYMHLGLFFTHMTDLCWLVWVQWISIWMRISISTLTQLFSSSSQFYFTGTYASCHKYKNVCNFQFIFHKIKAKYHNISHSLCKHHCVKREAIWLRLHFWPAESTTIREPLMPLITDVEKSKHEGSSGMPLLAQEKCSVCANLKTASKYIFFIH